MTGTSLSHFLAVRCHFFILFFRVVDIYLDVIASLRLQQEFISWADFTVNVSTIEGILGSVEREIQVWWRPWLSRKVRF